MNVSKIMRINNVVVKIFKIKLEKKMRMIIRSLMMMMSPPPVLIRMRQIKLSDVEARGPIELFLPISYSIVRYFIHSLKLALEQR